MLLLAFLLPPAIYLLILAQINRRARPLMVSGPWDFAGILFAASGFLLVGGPAVLSSLSLNDGWRRFWLTGDGPSPAARLDRLFTVRIALFAAYFLVVVGGAAFLLWRRRRVTAIYNVDADAVAETLDQTLQRWQLPYAQVGNMLIFEPDTERTSRQADKTNEESDGGPDSLSARSPVLLSAPRLVTEPTRLEVEVASGMRHVTLRWDPPHGLLRQEVEAKLERSLAETPAPVNPLGDWLLVISGLLFFLFLAVLTVVTLVWLFGR